MAVGVAKGVTLIKI